MKYKKHIYTVFNVEKWFASMRAKKRNRPFAGYSRVYHHHLMKTGGTSLNHMFLNLSNGGDDALYERLMNETDLRLIYNDWVYTAWNQIVISSGLYHYAWSHRPIYRILLPPNTFVITCIRHPYFRIYSRYKQLVEEYNQNQPLKYQYRETKDFSSDFEEYLTDIPQSELCHQLYMFSKRLDVNEGFERLKNVNYVLTIDTFDADVQHLNTLLNTDLAPLHKRKSKGQSMPHFGDAFKCVDEGLRPELEFYKRVLSYKNL